MKPFRYILSTLILCSGVVLAATQVLKVKLPDTKKGDTEKVRLGENYYAGLQQVDASQYPLRVQAGSADGIPYGLRCDEVKDLKVSLSWNTPEAVDGYFDDFEDHDDFAVNSAGRVGWTYIDGDNRNTYSWSACTFKNQGQKMAFIVMNPSETTPSVEANPKYTPASGKKMLVSMCAIGAPNNDWIISPQLSFQEDFKISFRAKSYRTDGIAPERIRVGYSTTGKTQSAFNFVTPSPYLELPDVWDLYEYTIPKEARYVCINCVSDDAFMLLIDDIMIGTNEVRPNVMEDPDAPVAGQVHRIQGRHLTGFNIYRDGQKVNKAPVKEVRYTDTANSYDVHAYTVTALYSDGSESAPSATLNVDVVDPRLLPFEDDFDDWTLHADRWSRPENPAGTESYWGIDYYTYGLVDPAATYGYSSLHNYDQSLVSRELRTLDRASTYARFDLRLCNWGQYENEVSYLAFEISCDGGKTWTTIDTYDNTKGEFDWTVRQYALKDYLKSDYFQLRWRAYGVYALHIDYWYVDDVKVWNPIWGSLRMNVSTADGPVNGANVRLTGSKGGVQQVTTDASGQVNLGQIEADTYDVYILKDGLNAYSGTVEITEGQTATPVIRMTRPRLELSTTSIQPDMAVEEQRTETFTVKNAGDGPLTWRMNYAPAKQSGKPLDFEINRVWNASGDVQTSIGFDGEYYYTSSWYYLGEFWKYDREGNLIEQFRIPDMYYRLYDLAYDGRYFYGSDYSNRIFQLDFENKRIVDIITISNAPDLEISHIAYNPNNDRFYVGGWNTLCEVRRNGRASSMAVAFDENQYHSIYGSAFDNVTAGGPYLWLSALEGYNEYMIDKIVIYQYNLNTKKFTGVKKAVTDLPGYKVGTAQTGVNSLGGLEGTYDVASGKYTLIGTLQQSPTLVFEYNLAEADTWLSYDPKKSTLSPGESTTVTVNLNARDGKVGQGYSNKVTINTLPVLPAQAITLGYQAVKASATPRPMDLTASNLQADAVQLNWKEPSVKPQSYNVWCNGQLLVSGITEPAYTVKSVVRGHYTYQVSAVYANGESVRSDAANLFVKHGAPFYAPLELQSSLSQNTAVTLNWKSPQAYASQATTLTWGSGEHADQLGLSDGGTFYAGTVWPAEDIVKHRGKQITSASIRLVTPLTSFAACVFKDGQLVLRQKYEGAVRYGEWNEVTFKSPVTIEAGSDYTIAFQIEHTAGLQPVGLDATRSKDGYGNMLSTDGEYWFPATQMAIEGNLCIRFDVQGTNAGETAPLGYNIYRNGQKVNAAPVTSTTYAETLPGSGQYSYAVTSVYAGGESLPGNTTTVNSVAIGERMAPSEMASHVECNREVSLYWGFPIKGKSTFPIDITSPVTTSQPGYPSYVNSFMAQGGEMGVASDCRYIYTSVHNEDGRINKYDLNGRFLEHFNIPGLDGIRNITYDGHDFWVSTVTTYIYKVDMEKHAILGQYPISEYARHFTYVPDLDGGKGGFELGDWETSIYTARNGSKISTGPSLRGACGTAYHDGKLYAFEQGAGNPYTIGIYDFNTSERIGEINLGLYAGLSNIESASAGGMSVVHTPEGLTLLAVGIQNTMASSQFLFLDLGSVSGVCGYNIYRNGKKLNSAPVQQRYFQETVSQEGEYEYQIETCYVDGSVSPKSESVHITILPTGTADAPVEVKAQATSYGYNVAVSYADPALPSSSAIFESLENQNQGIGQPATVNGWNNEGNHWLLSDQAYHGVRSVMADTEQEAMLILPAGEMKWIGFAGRNADDHQGNGTLQVLASEDDIIDNFILVSEFQTTELWSSFGTGLPEGTRYVMLRKPAGAPMGYMDALRLNPSEPQSQVYSYDIFRDGRQVNSEPVRSISYMDHNLEPGTYTYQVRQRSVTSALSPLSEPFTLDLQYSNGGQAPGNLRVLEFANDHTDLKWDAPALGENVYLKWHSGNSSDAAGLPYGGAFYAGVRWLASDIKEYANLTLSEVEVYINQIPDALYLLVYQGNRLVHSQYVPNLHQYGFNTILLDKPIPMDATSDLRVIVYVEHNEITVPLGYDEGPAMSGRGNIYSSDGTTWTTMDDEDTGISGNWNISIGLKPYSQTAAKAAPRRQKVEDSPRFPMYMPQSTQRGEVALRTQSAGSKVTSNLNTFDGYNLYANNERVNERPILSTSYTDYTDYTTYPFVQFKVAAVYSQLGEVFAPMVTINTTAVETLADSGVRVGFKEGTLRILGAKSGTPVCVYDASGRLVLTATVSSTSLSVVPAPLPAGVYVVKVGDSSFKGTVR